MNLTKKITVAIAVLSTTVASFAQTATAPAANASIGNLGQRYAQFDLSLTDPNGSSDNGYGAGLGVNLPVNANIDLGFNYGYGWLDASGFKVRDHSLSTTVAAYTNYNGVKPFVGVGLGYQWSETKFGGFSSEDDHAIWGVTIGAEVPVSNVAFTPSVSYVDNFENSSNGAYNYGVEASTWVTAKVAVFADVSYTDVVGNGGQGWTYTLGARLKF